MGFLPPPGATSSPSRRSAFSIRVSKARAASAVERAALVKMLQCVGTKAPAQKRRDKQIRLFACAARVFVEANETVAGTEALVFADGTCILQHDIFLKNGVQEV